MDRLLILMRAHRGRLRSIACAMLVATLLTGQGSHRVYAGALQVSPLTVRLSKEQPIVTLRVRNVDRRQVIMQADVFSWSQPNGQDAYAATDDVVVIPPIFSLAPGAQQLLRVGLPGSPPRSDVERAYRVFLRELSAAAAPADGQLQLALRIGLPIFVAPGGPREGDVTWRLEGSPHEPVLRVRNRSGEHVKITAVRFLTRDGSVAEEHRMLRYCLADTDVSISLPQTRKNKGSPGLQVVFKSGDEVKTENIHWADDTLASR